MLVGQVGFHRTVPLVSHETGGIRIGVGSKFKVGGAGF